MNELSQTFGSKTIWNPSPLLRAAMQTDVSPVVFPTQRLQRNHAGNYVGEESGRQTLQYVQASKHANRHSALVSHFRVASSLPPAYCSQAQVVFAYMRSAVVASALAVLALFALLVSYGTSGSQLHTTLRSTKRGNFQVLHSFSNDSVFGAHDCQQNFQDADGQKATLHVDTTVTAALLEQCGTEEKKLATCSNLFVTQHLPCDVPHNPFPIRKAALGAAHTKVGIFAYSFKGGTSYMRAILQSAALCMVPGWVGYVLSGTRPKTLGLTNHSWSLEFCVIIKVLDGGLVNWCEAHGAKAIYYDILDNMLITRAHMHTLDPRVDMLTANLAAAE
eukprot:1203703-Amphidinium_carterae.1